MEATGRLEYQPALDGVRCLAVVAVMLFHAGTPGFDGGYLGVSVFFTLSGYLVTSLIMQEHRTSGTVRLGAFYGRRVRRLLPASIATVVAVVVIAAVTDVFDEVVGLRAQAVGSLLQVANWVLLAGSSSYQDLLAEGAGVTSPLAHFWSLAIEEQFYWIWPPLMALLLTRVPARTSRIRIIGVLTLATMLAAPLIANVWGPDAAYWATPARLGEILVGAFLAFALTSVTVPGRVSLLAPVSLVILAVAVVMFPSSSGPAYEGLLPLVAVVSGGLILGLQADGPLRRALSAGPLVAIGRISYGLYLVHWPVFVIVDADRTGLDGPVLTALRLLITAAIAVASYFVIEQPIRLRHAAPARLTLGAGALASVGTAAIALVLVSGGPTNYWRADDGAVDAAAIGAVPNPAALTASSGTTPTSTAPDPTVTAPDPSVASPDQSVTSQAPATTEVAPSTTRPELQRPVRIVVTGDSTADALGTGVVQWAANHPDLAQAEVHAALGCGFVMGGERLFGGEIVETGCLGWTEEVLYPDIEQTQPDVLAVMTSVWDVTAQRWDGGELLTPLDPEYRARLVEAYTNLVERATAAGAQNVVFIEHPVPRAGWEDSAEDEADPARHQVLFEVYAEVAAAYPSTVHIVDLASWFTEQGLDDDREIRPDGVHLEPVAATSIVERFLGDQLIDAALS
jgi:peptidoglycan/LPS O-acetylase OafA/YrhL